MFKLYIKIISTIKLNLNCLQIKVLVNITLRKKSITSIILNN